MEDCCELFLTSAAGTTRPSCSGNRGDEGSRKRCAVRWNRRPKCDDEQYVIGSFRGKHDSDDGCTRFHALVVSVKSAAAAAVSHGRGSSRELVSLMFDG